MRRLADLQPGERSRVTAIECEADAARRLMDLGLIRGTPIEVVRAAPFGDPLEIRLRGFMLTLRRAEAELISVE